MLRYLNPQTADALCGLARPQIGFGYLGRFPAAGTGEGGDWQSAAEAEALGSGADPDMALPHVIEINALTEDSPDGPRLTAHWAWAGELLPESDVRELAHDWCTALRTLAEYATTPDAAGPSSCGL